MALIPAAVFDMGTDAAKVPVLLRQFRTTRAAFFSPEQPRHRVRLAAYRIDRREVTNAEFATFVISHSDWRAEGIVRKYHNGAYLAHWLNGTFPAGTGQHPVTYITWYAAAAYCDSLGKRLPTEAEWEYAARGGLADAEFPWGDEMPDVSRANWSASELKAPTRVGTYSANGYGLYDMAGNVWEYVQDEWRENYEPTELSGNRDLIPLSAALNATTRRVIRGGSWGGSAINLRVRYRDSHPPAGAGDHVGFRCARSAASAPSRP